MSKLAFLLAYMVVVTLAGFFCAFTARMMGDATAKEAGFLTLHPLMHIDPIGSLILLCLDIGWGRNVPINPHNISGTLRLALAYFSTVIAYIFVATVSLSAVMKLFGTSVLGIINEAFINPLRALHLLYEAYPDFSSLAITGALFLLAAVYISVLLAAFDIINHGCRLGLILFYPRIDYRIDSCPLLLFIPLLLMIGFIGPLIHIISLVVVNSGEYLAHILGA